MTVLSEAPLAPDYQIGVECYNRSPEELELLEQDAVSQAMEATGKTEGVVAVMAGFDHPLADFGRTYETGTFQSYDFHAAMSVYEPHSQFLYLVDLDAGRIAHTKRIVGPKTPEEAAESGLTGIEMVDDRLRSQVTAEQVTVQEILSYHHLESLDNTFNIATNIDTGRVPQTLERPHGLLSYKASFKLASEQGTNSIFAYVNAKAVKSLSRLGIDHELLAGQEFHLPYPLSTTEYDHDYLAVCLPDSDQNRAAFTQGNPDMRFSQMIAATDVPLIHAA
jgi:hypothetical protein